MKKFFHTEHLPGYEPPDDPILTFTMKTSVQKPDIMVRIRDAENRFWERTGSHPRSLILNEADEYELLSWIRNQTTPLGEQTTLQGCRIMEMDILLEKDVLSLPDESHQEHIDAYLDSNRGVEEAMELHRKIEKHADRVMRGLE